MDERPQQPPEGRLIAAAAERLDLSIREAARRAGLSYGRWRQITQGYQNVSPGEYAKVHAPARTLAKMAAVAGVTPEQMETEGQRPDAAAEMRSFAAAPPPARLLPAALGVYSEAELAPHLQSVRNDLADAMREYGPEATPKQIFPNSPHEAIVWSASNVSAREREYLIAAMRKGDADEARSGRHRVVLAPP